MSRFRNFWRRKPPLSLDGCRIEITRAESPSFLAGWPRRIFRLLFTIPERLKTTYRLIKHSELREPMARSMCPMKKLSPLLSAFFSFKMVANPPLMKALLHFARKNPNKGLFNDKENSKVLLFAFKDMYPSETIREDDSIFTCHQDVLQMYRQPILKFLGPETIRKQQTALEEIADGVLKMAQKPGEAVNAADLSMTYATAIIPKLLLGHPGSLEVLKEISSAIDFLNKHALKKAWHQPISKQEEQLYRQSVERVKEAIETSLTSQEKPAFGSLVDAIKGKMTDIQMRSTLFFMYFAGSETSASLLSYMLWQLGQHPKYQEEIFQELAKTSAPLYETALSSKSIERFFAESIRLFCPTYVIGRQPTADLVCKATNQQGEVVFQEKIYKEEGILCAPTFAARDPDLYPEPNQFNPSRFQNPPKTLPWLPFGDGQHSCPGQWLAKAEVSLFVALVVQKYHIGSRPSQEMGQKGYLTLKSSEEIWLTLTPR